MVGTLILSAGSVTTTSVSSLQPIANQTLNDLTTCDHNNLKTYSHPDLFTGPNRLSAQKMQFFCDLMQYLGPEVARHSHSFEINTLQLGSADPDEISLVIEYQNGEILFYTQVLNGELAGFNVSGPGFEQFVFAEMKKDGEEPSPDKLVPYINKRMNGDNDNI